MKSIRNQIALLNSFVIYKGGNDMFVVIIENNGKYVAMVNDNTGTYCGSHKEAERIAATWNDTYKRNNCLLK